MAYIDIDKDIRYYTDRLEEKLDDKQDEINTLTDNIESLSNKIDSTVVCIKTLNEMVEMISKRVGLKDDN